MRLIFGLLLVSALGLAGCESRKPANTDATQPTAVVDTLLSQRPVARILPPDTLDYAKEMERQSMYPQRDTLIQLGSHHYWLTVKLVADSTRPIDFAPAELAGRYFAAPSDTAWRAHRVRGYDGTYTFTLRDSTRQRLIFSRLLHKKDLRAAGPPEMVTVSEPDFYYCGYSTGLNALLFTVEVGIPSSDVGYRAALLLDARTGQVQALHDIGSSSFDATDCNPRVAPNGQAVLTCADELLRPGRPSLSLKRPHAELRAARFLTDTTFLVIYAFGDYRPAKLDEEVPLTDSDDPSISASFSQPPPQEFVSTPAQARAANAFIYSTSGRVLRKFKYDGWEPAMGYALPRYWLAATRTHYLVSEGKDLVLLPRAQPGTFQKLPIKRLPKFHPPRRPQEAQFTLYSDAGDYTFYVDKAKPEAIRYQFKPIE